jgi:hypothetical protein
MRPIGHSIQRKLQPELSKYGGTGETGDDIKPTLHYLYKNGIGGILDYAAEDDVQSEGGPASREPENEHIIARTFDYESEVGCRALRARYRCRDACSVRCWRDVLVRTGRSPAWEISCACMQAKCDRHMDTFLKSIKAAAASEGQGYAAIKVSK